MWIFSGVETVEMKHVADGNRIRTYVLVALPTTGRMNKDIKRSAKEAFKELDEITGNKPLSTDVEVQPVTVTPVAPQKSQEISVLNPMVLHQLLT